MFDLPLGTELKIMAKSGKNQTFRIKKLIFYVSGPCFFPFQGVIGLASREFSQETFVPSGKGRVSTGFASKSSHFFLKNGPE